MYIIRKIPKQNRYKVYNKETKETHSFHNNKSDAMQQVEILHESLGEGIFNKVKHFAHKVADVAQKVIHGREKLSPKVENILNTLGDAHITGIKIGRTPIPAVITGFIKTVSNTPYDELFHLFIVLSTTKGEVLLEKNQVINMDLHPNIKAEYITIHQIPHNLTVEELIHNTQKQMGDHKFISYSAYDNNCQDFIKNVLQANGINEGLDFVKQDTEDIFKNNNNLRKFVNTVTDIAGRANVFLQGGEISCDRYNNGLYGDEIENILNKHGYHINGVFSKDKLPKTLKDGWYVINLQSTNEGNRKGTHWTCFKSTDNAQIIEYFDAFGFAPPVEIMEKANGDILYSDKQIQDINATTCGWFCIAAIVSNKSTESPQSHFKKFISMFSDNTHINDGILAKYLHRKDIQ